MAKLSLFGTLWGYMGILCLLAFQDKLLTRISFFLKKKITNCLFFFFPESPVRTQIIGHTDIGYKYKFDLKLNCYPSSKQQILHCGFFKSAQQEHI